MLFLLAADYDELGFEIEINKNLKPG